MMIIKAPRTIKIKAKYFNQRLKRERRKTENPSLTLQAPIEERIQAKAFQARVLCSPLINAISIACCICFLLLSALPANAQKAEHKTWVDPETATKEDRDFTIQGEYQSEADEKPLGAQVVALGSGQFDIYILEGGLPGSGWEPAKSRTKLQGSSKDDRVDCSDDLGKCNATIAKGILSLTTTDGATLKLARIERQSPTLGKKPPNGALVLFDGTSVDQWENGKMENGFLLSTGSTTKRLFSDYSLHLEFRTPYTPTARGQQRGNSGVYFNGRWETQVLDSFGLDGKDNECGGVYSIAKPRLNMCFPPLAWQTYDVEFTAAKFDADGKRSAWPSMTVRLNGVLVHKNLQLNKDFTTSAPMSKPLSSPEGPIFLQDHGNPVVFRNIWLVPKGES